jgi:hypothetical protein
VYNFTLWDPPHETAPMNVFHTRQP